jgi:hypothetical protein
MKKRKSVKWIAIIAGGAILTCVCLVAFGLYVDSTPSGQAANATRVATGTQEALAAATDAARPTDQPLPTDTPAPTSTPSLAPAFETFIENYETMTDAQWENFADGVAGTYIHEWHGRVSNVDAHELLGGYTAQVDVGRRSISEVSIDVSEDVALALNKDQEIVFSGTVDYVSNSFGLTIKVKDAVIEPVE